MPNTVTCSICSKQVPIRIEELSKSFNKGLLPGNDDSEDESDDDNDPSGDDDSSDDDDDDCNDEKTETLSMSSKLLIKAKEKLQGISQIQLFKFSNKTSKDAMSLTSQ